MKRNTSYRKSQQLYKAFNEALASFDDIDLAIIGLTSSGEIVYVNSSACDLLGYPKDELEGSLLRTIAPDMTAQAWSSFWSALDRQDLEQQPTTLHLSGTKKLSAEFRTLFIHQSSLKYCLMTKPGEAPAAAVTGGGSYPAVGSSPECHGRSGYRPG